MTGRDQWSDRLCGDPLTQSDTRQGPRSRSTQGVRLIVRRDALEAPFERRADGDVETSREAIGAAGSEDGPTTGPPGCIHGTLKRRGFVGLSVSPSAAIPNIPAEVTRLAACRDRRRLRGRRWGSGDTIPNSALGRFAMGSRGERTRLPTAVGYGVPGTARKSTCWRRKSPPTHKRQ